LLAVAFKLQTIKPVQLPDLIVWQNTTNCTKDYEEELTEPLTFQEKKLFKVDQSD
jgi:hypothetical protein